MKLARLAWIAFFATGCGARGPLDLEVVDVYPDASLGDAKQDSAAHDATTDAPDTSDAAPDGEGPTPDAAPDAQPPPNPIACVSCVAQQCGSDFAMCFQDMACRTTLQCVFTMCLAGGGGGGTQCFLQCANGNPQELISILKIVACLGSKCGQSCGGLLPDGGLGGFGG